MSPESGHFESDLDRWEMGELGMSELEELYPDRDVRGLAQTWLQLRAASSIPVPDPERSWMSLRSQLGSQPTHIHTRPAGLRRLAVVASVAAVITTGTAIAYGAGGPSVRNTFNGVVGRLTDIFEPPVEPVDDTTPTPGRTKRPANRSNTKSERTTQVTPEPEPATRPPAPPPAVFQDPPDFENQTPPPWYDPNESPSYPTRPPYPYFTPTPRPEPSPTPTAQPSPSASPSSSPNVQTTDSEPDGSDPDGSS